MGVEFSCCTTEMPSAPGPDQLPLQRQASLASEFSIRPSNTYYSTPSTPILSMSKLGEETGLDASEFRAANRMFRDRKGSEADRRVCSIGNQNPFEVSDSYLSRQSYYSSSSYNRRPTEDTIPPQYRSEIPSSSPLYPDFEYHSTPKWYRQQREGVSLVSLSENSEKYREIVSRVRGAGEVEVLRIEKVRNSMLYKGFAEKHEDVSKLEGASQSILELFYGTGRVDPYLLSTNLHGLDSPSIQVFSQPMTCFTSSAHSALKFAYRRKDGTRQMLLCFVTVGDPVDVQPDEDLSEPPNRPEPGRIVLSARIRKRKSTVWVVYERRMSYPAYVLTLRVGPANK